MTFKKKFMTMGVGLAIGVSALSTSFAHANSNQKFYIGGVPANDTLNIRDVDTFKVLTKVKNGDIVTKKKDLTWKKGWSLVQTSNGTIGVCNTGYLKTKVTNNTNSTTNSNTKVTSKKIEFRKGPGYSHPVVTTVGANTKVDFLSNTGDWAKFKYKGQVLYCPKYYIVNSKSNTTTNNTNVSATNKNDTKIYKSSGSVTLLKSAPEGVHNAKIALKALNGYTINPGAKFSFYKAIGSVSRAKGYVDAPVIKNGVKSSGLGGGICIASSAVFNAIIDAGIKPTERKNHSLPSAYVKRGLDAMVSRGSSDLAFINTTGKKLTINTSSANGNATVTISSVGDHRNGYTFKPKTIESKNRLNVDTYMQRFKNGVYVDQVLISRSKYLK